MNLEINHTREDHGTAVSSIKFREDIQKIITSDKDTSYKDARFTKNQLFCI